WRARWRRWCSIGACERREPRASGTEIDQPQSHRATEATEDGERNTGQRTIRKKEERSGRRTRKKDQEEGPSQVGDVGRTIDRRSRSDAERRRATNTQRTPVDMLCVRCSPSLRAPL